MSDAAPANSNLRPAGGNFPTGFYSSSLAVKLMVFGGDESRGEGGGDERGSREENWGEEVAVQLGFDFMLREGVL